MQAEGFIKGRPMSLAVLDYGLFQVHSNGRIIGIAGFAIQTDKNETILIDTGLPEKYTIDAETASMEDQLDEFGEVLECTLDNLPAAQLAKLGLTSENVALHICTHTHIDHVGGLHTFPEAPILISANERKLAKPLYWGSAQPLDWPECDYLRVEGDVRVGPGLTVLEAPGHSPGQIALLVELPSQVLMLTSDAISRLEEFDEKFVGAWDEATAHTSAERLMKLAAEKDAYVIYGHCPKQWPSLRKAPETYS